MNEDITIHGGKGSFAPGLMDWCMACNRKTFQKETRDVGARMFALSGFMPDVPAGQLRRIAEREVTYTVDEDGNTVTLHTKERPKCST